MSGQLKCQPQHLRILGYSWFTFFVIVFYYLARTKLIVLTCFPMYLSMYAIIINYKTFKISFLFIHQVSWPWPGFQI
jgi:hypothetical protein